MAVSRKSIFVAFIGLWTVAFLGLSGCGGGGGGGDGGGGGGSGADFLKLVANVFWGEKAVAGVSTIPYPTDPTGGIPIPANSPVGSYQVPAAVFPVGAPGSQSFIELRFNRTVLASSITSPVPTGSDGIVVFVIQNGPGGTPPCALVQGAPVCMRLDAAGVVDPSNTVINGEAPATVRLYYDPDNNLTTPDNLPMADYSLVITNTLRAANGGPFCVGNGSSNCSNTYLPVLPFTIGPNTTPIDLSSTTPMIPTPSMSTTPIVPINSEVILNFIDSVDFVSVAGGLTNLTALDPFISIPFMLGTGPAPNITVTYNPPTDPITQVPQTLPLNLGFVLYMPDPILNPTQIRVRFVEITNLQPANTGGVFQNYASNPSKLPIQSQDPSLGGSTLQLPPIKAVPGSLLASDNVSVGPATVTIAVTTGVTDRAGLPGGTPNAYQGAFMGSFTWAIGPTLARNPVPPDATFVGSLQGGPVPFDKPGITVVDTAHTTGDNTLTPCTNIPATYGPPITGVLTLLPPNDRIANTAILGVPGDIEVGTFLNPANTITDSPRGTVVPGVMDDANGTAPSGILNCLNPMIPPPNPPYGNRLYVTDTSSGSLKVFNSFDFSLITQVVGVASPYGLGISPDLQFLYVSNNLQGTVQRINSNPASPQFHTIVNTVTVGVGPRAVSVHPDNEDVIVCNFAEDSISIIRTNTQTERVRLGLQGGLGPSDALITRRMLCMGCTAEYMAFIPCLFSNSVRVYESNGGAVLENNPQGRIIASLTGFLGPARGTWNWVSVLTLGPSGTNGPGCFIANSFGASVDRIYLFSFTLSPPPGFPGPAGQRVFVHDPIATNFSNPSDVSIDNMSGLYNVNVVGTPINKRFCDIGLGGGAPSVLVVSYPSLGKCVAYDYNSPAFFSEVSVPGCDFLQAYYDQ